MKSGGCLFVILEQFCITILLSMVILLILLIWFHHMDTILLVLLVCLNFISKDSLLNEDYSFL